MLIKATVLSSDANWSSYNFKKYAEDLPMWRHMLTLSLTAL